MAGKLLPVLVLISLNGESFGTCEPSDFVCDDGTCLPRFFVCDGYPLCLEGEDEDPCYNGCEPGQYRCYRDNSCIPYACRCDGVSDCPEGEDEISCSTSCSPSEVMCSLYFCLPNNTMCDGFQDCFNGNDELDCPHTCASSSPLTISGSAFSSPNFPAPNTDLQPCLFSANAPKNEKVVIIFTAFDSYDSELGCLFELSIEDPSSGTILEANCGSAIPPPVVSDSNVVRIFYSTYGNAFSQGKGFEASVKFVNRSDLDELQCGYTVFLDEGYLLSPGFPDLYPNNFDCVSSIVAPPGQIVRLSFISFNVEDHYLCGFDSLSVYDVISFNSRLIVRLCGSSLPEDITSSETALSVVFTTDSFVRSTGYKAFVTFETPECRRVIYVSQAYYFSDDDMDCTYLFQAEPEYALQIIFSDFDPFSCENETYLVFDGNSTNASLLTDFCDFPTFPVTTTGREMLLVIESPFHFPNFGLSFLIDSFLAVTVPCSNSVFRSSAVFTSPNYPNSYSRNESCEYFAEAQSGKIVTLNFDYFDLGFSTNCEDDSVKVYDGRDTNATLLANLCGFGTPSTIRSTSNAMLVIFTSDNNGNERGFQAAFVFVNDTSPSCIEFLLTERSFEDSNQDCIYYLNTGVAGQQVVVYFLMLDLDCDLDTLLVYDGGSFNSPLLLDSSIDMCPHGSDILLNVHSSGRDMLILFVSTNHSPFRGIIEATAFADIVANDDCGGFFNESGSTFYSPNFPLAYNNHDDCEYLAVAPDSKIVEVVFSSFTLEGHPTCIYDSIRIYDGNSTNAPLLATFCGSVIPEGIFSTGNSLLVKFTSDYSVTSGGFAGTFNIISSFFEAGCNQFVNVSGDVLRSRYFPGPYGDNANCHYLIQAPHGKNVHIFFLSFQVEPDCFKDSLMIFDGNSTNATLLDTLCGFEIPALVKTSGNEAYLLFKSDNSISYLGFLASAIFVEAGTVLSLNSVKTIAVPNLQQHVHYATNVTDDFSKESTEPIFTNNITTEVSVENEAPCGTTIFVNGTTISSPNFTLQDNYDNDIRCSFFAFAPIGYVVLLIFDSFDLEFEPSCLWDFVEVTDLLVSDEDLGKFCGSTTPEALQSSSYRLDILFFSDASITRPGFNATIYFIEQGVCRETFNISGSRFTSPNFPFTTPPELYCEYLSSTSEGQIVELIFTFFDVGFISEDCNFAGSVKVYDGNSTSDPLLATLCGDLLPRNIFSTGNEMLVTYDSDFFTNNGFEAFFNFLSEEVSCFEEVTESSIVRSYSYSSNITTCTHQIQAPQGFRVALIFTSVSFFTVLSGDCLSNDTYQFGLWVFDGPNDAYPVLLRHCSPSLPHLVKSSGYGMQIRSSTSRYLEEFGFSAVIKFLNSSQDVQLIIQSGNFITSPSFENNALYYYLIVAPEGVPIVLSFTFFSLEDHPECAYDFLKVYDGDSVQSPHLVTLCGCLVPNPVVSTQNQMFLQFSTDFVVSSAGFTAMVTFAIENLETTQNIQTTRSDEFATTPEGPEATTSFGTTSFGTDSITTDMGTPSFDVATTSENVQTGLITTDAQTTSFDGETTREGDFEDKGLENNGKVTCHSANPCVGSHVICMDDSTDPYCVCESGYQFTDNSQLECLEDQDRLQKDDKPSCDNANPCSGSHVTCMDDSIDPYCVCERGYQFVDSSELECTDVDECITGLNSCDLAANLVCLNKKGGYSCRCREGFTMSTNGICMEDSGVSLLLVFRITAINQQETKFSTELLDETSEKYNNMASFTCSSVMEVLGDTPSATTKDCSALGFRSGSIKVFLQLEVVPRGTTLSTMGMKETFLTNLSEDSDGFKVLKRINGDFLTLDESSLRFEYVNGISCDNFVCHNGGTCQLDAKTYERQCICTSYFTGLRCETRLAQDAVTTTRTGSEDVLHENTNISNLIILIPIAVAAGLMFLLSFCCCVALKHKANKTIAVVDQVKPVDVNDSHRLNFNTSGDTPIVIRNPGARRITNRYNDLELEEERRLKHFERIFSENVFQQVRGSSRHSISQQTDDAESTRCLSEFSHPFTADGSLNL